MSRDFHVRPRVDVAEFCRYIYREFNTVADRLANKYSDDWTLSPYTRPEKGVGAFCDGSRRGNQARYGWVVYALPIDSSDELCAGQLIATKSCRLPDGATITAAELEAAWSVLSFLAAYYEGYDSASAAIRKFPTIDYRTLTKLSLAELV